MGKKAATKTTAKKQKKNGVKKTVGKPEHTVEARVAILREGPNSVQATAPAALLKYTKENLQRTTAVALLITIFWCRATITEKALKCGRALMAVQGLE